MDGLGLEVLWEKSDPGPGGADRADADLFVLYLDGPVDEELVARLVARGGERVPSHDPYWESSASPCVTPTGTDWH